MKVLKNLLTFVLLLSCAFTNVANQGNVTEVSAAFSESVAKNAALQMTATLENSTTELQYNYAEYLGDGRGITFGAIGFCTGTYDGNELIKYYTTLSPSNNLAKYIPALNTIDAGPHNSAGGEGNDSTTGLTGFVAAVESNTDPLFKQAQLHMLDELYWNPAHDIFTSIGAKNNLTMAFIYDMSIRQGADGAQDIVDEATDSLGGTPGTGVNENTYLSKLFSIRDGVLADEGLGDVDRDDGFKAVLASGNVNLVTPFTFTAYGDSFTIKSGTTATTYVLTVNSGNGDGSYAAGTIVTITAAAPATGKIFDKWTGSTSYVASTTSASTTVTMPSSNITITATYKDVVNNPGSVSWKGYTWDLRNGGVGSPGFGGWSSANVTTPDANGYITLKLTNPTGAAPIGAEMINQTEGLGYGTYTVVTGSRLDTLDKNVVFGGMFPFYYGNPYIEFDVNETSRWDVSTSDVLVSHNLWYGSDAENPSVHEYSQSIPADVVQTHRLIWEPGKATFDSFIGTGTGGSNYFHTVVTQNVPAPSQEQVLFNLWAYAEGTAGSSDKDAPATNVILRDFTFAPYSANPTTYALTVTNGTGDGSYAAGAKVTIAADAPASGMVFDKWTGGTAYVASTTSVTTTVTMPSSAVALTATYKAAPVSTYALTVSGGTGSGSYAAGTRVTITAAAPAAGKVFDKWTGSTSYVASTTSATTTVTMPSSAITLTATYKTATVATYALTVTNGTGDGVYAAGTKVTIAADAPSSSMVFDKWIGGTSNLASVTSATTTVTMPSSAITIAATYKTANATTYTLTVTNGTGDGSYVAGTNETIVANAPATGKVFDKWTGDISYLSSIYTATSVVTMPARAITVMATYKTAVATTYTLTVTSGAGGGSYAVGTGVTIFAETPPAGKVFDKWTGDTSYLSSIYTSIATVTMPSKAITLTATYKAVTTTTYVLTVNSGDGSGAYSTGSDVIIIAKVAAAGKVFDKWTGDTSYVSNAASLISAVTMPAKAITLTATYKDAVVTTYALSVNNGTGDGSYASGTKVTINADAPATGKVFDKWTGDTVYISDITSSSAIVTMPAKAITLTATYRDANSATYALTVSHGTGDGSYTYGTSVTITADSPATGKVFDKWTGDTTYVSSVSSASTTVTMPEKNITLTATYKDGTSAYPNGTLLKTPDSPKVYVVIDGDKKWISTPEVFEQLGYKWTSIAVVTEAALDKCPDYEDNLIRAVGGYKVYLVVNGVKRHIPNPNIFLDYGFSWGDVKDVKQEVIDKYKDTYLIRETGTQTVYYLNPDSIRKIIPTAAVFNSYNDNWNDVQIISKNEMKAYPLSNLIKLSGSNDVYLIEGTIKRKIPSVAVFNKYKFNWTYVIAVNQAEFNYYKIGAELK